MKTSTIVGTLGAMALVAGCAPSTAPDGTPLASNSSTARSCFFVDQVRGFRSVDRTTILLDAGRNRTYQAEAVGFCDDMDFALSIAIRPESRGSSRLCTGDFARLHVRGATMPNVPCRIRVVKVMTDEETAVLEKKTP